MKAMTDLEIINQLRAALQSTQHELATTKDDRDRLSRELSAQHRVSAQLSLRIVKLEWWLVESGAEATTLQSRVDALEATTRLSDNNKEA